MMLHGGGQDMRERLFDEDGSYTRKALSINKEIQETLFKVLEKYSKKIDIRDMENIIMASAGEASLEWAIKEVIYRSNKEIKTDD